MVQLKYMQKKKLEIFSLTYFLREFSSDFNKYNDLRQGGVCKPEEVMDAISKQGKEKQNMGAIIPWCKAKLYLWLFSSSL